VCENNFGYILNNDAKRNNHCDAIYFYHCSADVKFELNFNGPDYFDDSTAIHFHDIADDFYNSSAIHLHGSAD
jgi:hypothetical protein